MKGSGAACSQERVRVLNAVPLGNAVLCAECEVVSDSPHDVCMVCGSRSLFNVARVLGGKLPKNRAALIAHEEADGLLHEVVLRFPKPHRPRRRATASAQPLAVISLSSSEGEEVDGVRLLGPKAR